jgi:hypothetical protein
MTRDWPFEDPPNVAIYTTVNVLDRGDPILLVCHDADDGAWQFLCGRTNDPADGRVIGLDCALGMDPSLAELADLPQGWRAWREHRGRPWTRQPSTPEDEEQ